MKEWFGQFNQREQLSLLILAVAVGFYLLFIAIWRPVVDLRDQMALRNVGTGALLERVDSMVSEVIHLRESGVTAGPRRNLTALINQSTAEAALQVSRLQPNSQGEIQVRLEGAAFDDVLAWLHRMEYREGLLVREVSITQSGSSGRVNATIRVAQGG